MISSDPIRPELPTLLYVEDEDNDVLFMRRALSRAGVAVNFQTVCDGDKAVSWLEAREPYESRPLPRLILLDLNLPARSGFEVLEWFRAQPALQRIPVVIFSSSGRPEDREKARSLGASDYLLKPTSTLHLVDIARDLHARWLTAGADAAAPSA